MAELEIVRIPVTEDKADVLIALLEQARSDYLAPPACRRLDVARGAGEVVAAIHWSSTEVHHAAAAGPAAGELFAKVMALASGAPSVETLAIASDGGRLAGQVALVTGGASGIGRAVVERFVHEGAKVVVADVNEEALRALGDAHPGGVITVLADLTTVEGNLQAVSEAQSRCGGIDILVVNAGLFDGFFDFASIGIEQLNAGFDAVFDVNVRALLLSCRAALPALARSKGTIIVTLSNASLYPDGGGALYVASKHAALGIVRQLAHELAPIVRVNAVAPGATRTSIGVPAALGGPMDQTDPQISAAIASVVPLGLHAAPEDHAAAYVLLASREESRAMTGTVIESDGGLGIRGLRRLRGGDDLEQRVSG